MESFWHIISSGLLIGIFISAPMGPIGMLVIQRTLNKGRRMALFTGVGAALSDLTYSLLTGLGLSFITDFIIAKEFLLQIIGSVVLIAFAFYLFRKNPTLALKSRMTHQAIFGKILEPGSFYLCQSLDSVFYNRTFCAV